MAKEQAAHRTREWLQLNVALARHNGSALPAARAFFRDLESALPRGRQRSTPQFFFQRKAPDLRLRFFGVREDLVARLRPVISRVKSQGHILRSFYSVYEPEQRQFGGRDCMRCVHTFWEADSMVWITLDRMVEAEVVGIPHGRLIAAVLDDLFWRALSDGGEVWDTWCNLMVLLQGPTGAAVSPSEPASLAFLAETASIGEAEIIARYQQANARLAAGLQRAWQLGRMRCGIRSILPYVALFTLNRHGFDRPEAAAIAGTMAAIRDPKQQLRGAQPELVGSVHGRTSSRLVGAAARQARDAG